MARSAASSRRSSSTSTYRLMLGALVTGGLFAVIVGPGNTPAFLVIGALVLVPALIVWGRVRRRRRIRRLEADSHLEAIDEMSGTRFEHHVAGLLSRDGYRRVEVVGRAGDRGVDVTAESPDGVRVAVQCKRQVKTVGSPEIQRLIGAIHGTYAGRRGIFVTNNTFTRNAIEEGSLGGIVLIDRETLGMWLTGDPFPVPGVD